MSVELKKVYILKIDGEQQKEYSEETLKNLRDELNLMFPIKRIIPDIQEKRAKPLRVKHDWIPAPRGFRKGGSRVSHVNIAKVKASLDTERFYTAQEIADKLLMKRFTVYNVCRYLYEMGIVIRTREHANSKFSYKIKSIDYKPLRDDVDKISEIDENLKLIKDKARFQFRER